MKWYKNRRHEKPCLLSLLHHTEKAVMQMRKECTFHSVEEKLSIVKRYLSGESPKRLGKETGIRDGNIGLPPDSRYPAVTNRLERLRFVGVEIHAAAGHQGLHPEEPTSQSPGARAQRHLKCSRQAVLGRRFYAEAPLQKVVSDIAYMRQGVSRSMTVRFRSRLFHFSRVPR